MDLEGKPSCCDIKQISVGLYKLSITLFFLSVIFILQKTFRSRLPPGPLQLPILGNIHPSSRYNPWLRFQRWHEKYGPIYSLRYGSQTVVVVGSHKPVKDLLERRADIYSSRPAYRYGNRYMSRGLHTVLLPYGPQWRTHRRIQNAAVKDSMISGYRQIQDIESLQLLHDLLEAEDFSPHFHRYSSGVIFGILYGKRLEHHDQGEIQQIRDLADATLDAMTQRYAILIDLFPWLDYIPRVLAPWKRKGEEIHEEALRHFTKNLFTAALSRRWNAVQEASSIGDAQSLDIEELSYIFGILHAGGDEAAAETLRNFVMASVLHPKTVAEAQREIDKVVGSCPTRLPTFDDLPNLPYVRAIVQEVLRWRPTFPLGLPHAVSQDHEYMGYSIPKGTVIIPNQWALNRDEHLFPEPEEYRPDRWLAVENGSHSSPSRTAQWDSLASFGFGKRSCPGEKLARNSLNLAVARLLWGYNFRHKVTEHGDTVHIDPWSYTQKLMAVASPFEAHITVRSQDHESLIKSMWSGAEKDIGVILDQIRPKKGLA
ncbi:uncharacterized protein N7446_005535 [Penicillium canescens]|uniref:Cytochrome P450 n=1 Tax=Penicillium canescens TaxID=5083 RepID=A0AAD6NBD1_PENCN|nr:uncharacterized protein N7446_005535 [Penicillium canescens]KAJ6050226.1 hypothetical protein N7444_006942 [Penicillium canescens]KAJ6050910.1 hypothetical protein N7460_001444 [Penicillium canescens]KAJ6061415.1 hypothetical protein N7446_005535 [Penicillium canescens]